MINEDSLRIRRNNSMFRRRNGLAKPRLLQRADMSRLHIYYARINEPTDEKDLGSERTDSLFHKNQTTGEVRR